MKEYESHKNIILSLHESFLSSFLSLFDEIYKYLEAKTGEIENIEEFIYKKGVIPEFRGNHLYFIEKSNSVEFEKLYIKKIIRNYGYVLNSYSIIKCIKIEIYKQSINTSNLFIDDNINLFMQHDAYNRVLDDLQNYFEINKNKIVIDN